MLYTNHTVTIKITDHLNNEITMDYDFPMDCNFITAVSAMHNTYSYLLTALDAYAQSKGYASGKELPRNFKQTLNLKEVLEATKKG